MKKYLLPAKILLWIIALYHIVLGVFLIYSGDLSIRTADLLYGWIIEGSPELGILGEILGCYSIAFGLMMATAARDPDRHGDLISIGVVLIALRLFQRVVFAGKVMEVFQVPPGRYWSAFAFIFVLGAALAAVRLLIHRQKSASAA